MGWESINLATISGYVKFICISRKGQSVFWLYFHFTPGNHSAVQQRCKQCQKSWMASFPGGRGPISDPCSRRLPFLSCGQRTAFLWWVSWLIFSIYLFFSIFFLSRHILIENTFKWLSLLLVFFSLFVYCFLRSSQPTWSNVALWYNI